MLQGAEAGCEIPAAAPGEAKEGVQGQPKKHTESDSQTKATSHCAPSTAWS